MGADSHAAAGAPPAADPRAAAGRMEGGGYYTAHSQAQEAYGELGFEWLEQAAAEVAAPPAPLPFVICDMGAAGGGNSLEPMRRALAARPAGEPALVVHTDIPTNDFSALFELVATSPRSYLAGADGVVALAAGRSFYERLLPDRVLSLGWSSIAVHWLSAVPRPIPDHIYSSFATGEVRDALRERSAEDWRAFLDARTAELRPGGRLIVVGGAALDDGRSGAEGLMDMAAAALRAQAEAGTLRDSELARMTIPTWNRTTAEFVAPFEPGAPLHLRRQAARSLPDPYLAAYRDSGDLDRYVDDVAGFFRAAFEDSLWAALDADRDQPARDAVAAGFHEAMRAAIRAQPDRASCTWHVVVLDIERT